MIFLTKGWNSMKKTIKSLLFVTIYMSAMIFITSCNQDTQVLESRRSIKFIKKENLLIFYTENNGQENTYIDTLFLKKGEYYKNYYGGQKIIYLSNKRDTVIRIPPNQINSNEYFLYFGNTKKSPYKFYKKYESAIDGDLFESSLYIVKDDYRNRENDIRLMSSFLYDKDYKMIKYLRLHYDTYE